MTHYALFKNYPGLENKLLREELGNWPTPLQPLERLTAHLGGPAVYIKRDDLSSSIYGGNKVRKLELILAQAKRRGCREIITAGGLGSHHILATAALGSRAGYGYTHPPVLVNRWQQRAFLCAVHLPEPGIVGFP